MLEISCRNLYMESTVDAYVVTNNKLRWWLSQIENYTYILIITIFIRILFSIDIASITWFMIVYSKKKVKCPG